MIGSRAEAMIAERLLASRRALKGGERLPDAPRKVEAEGGCGVIGLAASVPVAGRHLLQSLVQMRNRGNGKGGGAALVGLDPGALGVGRELLAADYLLAIAYLDPAARAEVERAHVEPLFTIDHVLRWPIHRLAGQNPPPPEAVLYFVRVRRDAVDRFREEHGLEGGSDAAVEDELVYQNTYRLNQAFYASLGEKRAFVLSHGKDMLVLKMVGYGDDVIRAYGLDEVRAHVWIGHHRYPTKGRVWHPGGAHPFVGLHEALVHNGDFANYTSVCAYLAQRNIRPLFLTDTEVSVLVFDLLHRIYRYPLEHVIEALAPTTERDFTLLPPEKQRLYAWLQTVHMHGSPDGPWFFLIAQSAGAPANGSRTARLIGITDTSMLRPQVFALQRGGAGDPAIGLAASEKQAIDAALSSLAADDDRFWERPDRVWSARGGSHTDGGAFAFTIERRGQGDAELIATDKFGRRIDIGETSEPHRRRGGTPPAAEVASASSARWVNTLLADDARSWFAEVVSSLPGWDYEQVLGLIDGILRRLDDDRGRRFALEAMALLIDRRYPTGRLRRSSLLTLLDQGLAHLFDAIRRAPSRGFACHSRGDSLPDLAGPDQAVVIDARGFDCEGPESLALTIHRLVDRGFHEIIVAHARGHRFIGNGMGPERSGVRIEVHGSSGDYLASGIDGVEIVVHGSGQDQLAQIMKSGRLVVHGDVGQTFMYGAKGGQAYILGNAAGRPMINAVGRPRVVINGTCLDYLAEAFMAGDPFNGGGFIVLNGIAFNPAGDIIELDTPYPGGNLFSLASGGAIFVRDPRRLIGDDQLNGGEFATFETRHAGLVRPMLEENERLFGIPVERLLQVDGAAMPIERVYRAIVPAGHHALQPEEAWVTH